jgi:hypothetical protein
MATMPRSSNSVANLPFLLGVRDGSDLTNDLVTGDDRKAVAEQAMTDGVIRVTNTASEHLDQHLSRVSYSPAQWVVCDGPLLAWGARASPA